MEQSAKLAVYALLFDRKSDESRMTTKMVMRQNTGYRDGTRSLAAGRVRPGETPLQAVVREVKEELGITVNGEELLLVGCQYRLPEEGSDDSWVDFMFMGPAEFTWVTNNEPHIHSSVDDILLADELEMQMIAAPVQFVGRDVRDEAFNRIVRRLEEAKVMPHQIPMLISAIKSGDRYSQFDPRAENGRIRMTRTSYNPKHDE